MKIDFRPFIKVESLSAKEFRQQKISIADRTAVILHIRGTLLTISSICVQIACTVRETMKYFCTSRTIALYIQNMFSIANVKYSSARPVNSSDLVPSIVQSTIRKNIWCRCLMYTMMRSKLYWIKIKFSIQVK